MYHDLVSSFRLNQLHVSFLLSCFLHFPIFLVSPLPLPLITPYFLFLCDLTSFLSLKLLFSSHSFNPRTSTFSTVFFLPKSALDQGMLPFPYLLLRLKCACERSSSATVFPELSRSLSPYRQINLYLSFSLPYPYCKNVLCYF